MIKLMASDAGIGDGFGAGLDVTGDRILVGANRADGTGVAYVFDRDAGGPDAWGEVAKLAASDDAPGAKFGSAVALQGDLAAVGALLDDEVGTWSGSVYLYDHLDASRCPCAGDLDRDGAVAVSDLIELILAWGACPAACPADLDGDGDVGVADLVTLILAWGAC